MVAAVKFTVEEGKEWVPMYTKAGRESDSFLTEVGASSASQ